MSAGAEKPDEVVHEVVQEQPRRSREDILREFKLALAIGDGSLLEIDQDRARGVDPYDSGLGGRSGADPRGPGRGERSGHNFPGRAGGNDRLFGEAKARRRR